MDWPRRSPLSLLLVLALLLLFCLGAASAFLRPPCSLLQGGWRRSPAPSSSMQRRLTSMAADSVKRWDGEADVVVIGSGIGGLSAAALCAYYGEDVRVYESHYHAGGCAHSFEVENFKFDSGPSLWNGMDGKPGKRNPLGDILHIVGEADSVKYSKYTGWEMHIPEGRFKYEVGPTAFEETVRKFGGGEAAVQEWRAFLASLEPIIKVSVAMTPLALRSDLGSALTVGRFLPSLAAAGFTPAVTGPILDIAKRTVSDQFILRYLDFLSFAISGLPADSTIAAAMAYTLRDLHQADAELDYPVGGSGAIVDALVRAVNRHGHRNQGKGPEEPVEDRVALSAHVDKIIVENGRAIGIQLRKGGKRIRARKAVVSNASIWDTLRLLPEDSVDPSMRSKLDATPKTPSFLHLHLGIDATGLPPDLECHHTVINTWDPIDAPQNMAIISIPTTLDQSLAPPGHHVIHCYAAANEPYEPWANLKPGSPEYEAFKEERAEFLWKAVERVIPDVRQRCKVQLVASPLTHERFLRRSQGTYGPGWRAGKESFPGPKNIKTVKNLLCCGDSTFPGIGVPAVAASGAAAANTIAPVRKHWQMLTTLLQE